MQGCGPTFCRSTEEVGEVEMFESDGFLFTAETTPDVSTDLSASVSRVAPLVDLADAINVTDSPNCKTRLNSLLVASEIRRSGLDIILQLTGRDRNTIALESELLGALSVNINKVLCLSGDQPEEGGPVAVNELNSSGLIDLCSAMSNGSLRDGSSIKEPQPLFAGAADELYQYRSNGDAIKALVSKVEKGARFVQTQYCFDLAVIEEYSEKLSQEESLLQTKVLIGMGPLKSARQADWMRKNLWGVNISDEIVARLDQSDSPEKTGEIICQELIEQLIELPNIDGVHLMGPNCEKRSASIISNFR